MTKVTFDLKRGTVEVKTPEVGEFYLGYNSGNLFLQTDRGPVCVALQPCQPGYKQWRVGETPADGVKPFARALATKVDIRVEVE